jgi:hypothetical protein
LGCSLGEAASLHSRRRIESSATRIRSGSIDWQDSSNAMYISKKWAEPNGIAFARPRCSGWNICSAGEPVHCIWHPPVREAVPGQNDALERYCCREAR